MILNFYYIATLGENLALSTPIIAGKIETTIIPIITIEKFSATIFILPKKYPKLDTSITQINPPTAL